ncbi:MAG: response regulator, partial [Thioalkalispiraceae bacterium]
MEHEKVWIVDDDRSIRWVLEKAFKQAEMLVNSFDNAADALKALNKDQPDVIISDVRMPGMNGMDMMDEIHQQYPDIPVIIITAHSDLDSAVSAYQEGAFEYLPKPFDVDEAVELTRRALNHRREKTTSVETEAETHTDIIGEAPSMQ